MEVTEETINSYLWHCKASKRLSEHTLRAYRIDLHQLLFWLQASDANTLDKKQLEVYLAHLNSQFAASSVKRKVASIRAFAAHRTLEHGEANPFANMRISIREPQRLPRTITISNLSKLLSKSNLQDGATLFHCFLRKRDLAILELLLATGMRVSELCHLDIIHCNLSERQVRILGKGAKERLAHLESTATLEALQRYLDVRDEFLQASKSTHEQSSYPLFSQPFWQPDIRAKRPRHRRPQGTASQRGVPYYTPHVPPYICHHAT